MAAFVAASPSPASIYFFSLNSILLLLHSAFIPRPEFRQNAAGQSIRSFRLAPISQTLNLYPLCHTTSLRNCTITPTTAQIHRISIFPFQRSGLPEFLVDCRPARVLLHIHGTLTVCIRTTATYFFLNTYIAKSFPRSESIDRRRLSICICFN